MPDKYNVTVTSPAPPIYVGDTVRVTWSNTANVSQGWPGVRASQNGVEVMRAGYEFTVGPNGSRDFVLDGPDWDPALPAECKAILYTRNATTEREKVLAEYVFTTEPGERPA